MLLSNNILIANKMTYHSLKKSGFTLIELLVVIVIIGILVSFAVIGLNSTRIKSGDVRRVSDMKQIQTALEYFYSENNRYPTSGEFIIGGPLTSPSSGTVLIKKIPSNPTPWQVGACVDSGNQYKYYPVGDTNSPTKYNLLYCLAGNSVDGIQAGDNVLTSSSFSDEISCLLSAPSNQWVTTPYTNYGGWTDHYAASDISWLTIAYGDGKFVAGGQGSAVTSKYGTMISTDGINWIQNPSVDDQIFWAGMTYADGKFVAVGYNNNYDNCCFKARTMYSYDGSTWLSNDPSGNAVAGAVSVVYGAGKFVAVSGVSQNIIVSPDGMNWHVAANPINKATKIVYGNGIYLAGTISGSQRLIKSVDGENWSVATSALDAYDTSSLAFGDGKFVIVSGRNSFTSTDGVNWTGPHYNATLSTQVKRNFYGGGLFVAFGGGAHPGRYVSRDGVTWVDGSGGGQTTYWRSLVYGNRLFVGVANNGGSSATLVMRRTCFP